jgi:hypothetical protein
MVPAISTKTRQPGGAADRAFTVPEALVEEGLWKLPGLSAAGRCAPELVESWAQRLLSVRWPARTASVGDFLFRRR